ncbi:hypothetical protein AALP_AA5G021300, partial [Arabis alpina]
MEIPRSYILLLVIVLSSQKAVSVRYELKSGQTKCIGEDIHKNSLSVGKYFIVNPNEDHPLPSSHKIHVKVIPPQGKTMLHDAEDVESGQFSFTAYETGSYIACISVVDHKPEITLDLDFDWRFGVHHTNDWSKVAKKTQVD